jgi:hypothetical protein
MGSLYHLREVIHSCKKNAALGSGRLVFVAEMGDSLETCKERKSDDVIVKEVLFSLLDSFCVSALML